MTSAALPLWVFLAVSGFDPLQWLSLSVSRVNRITKFLARELEEQPVLFCWAQSAEGFPSSYPSSCDRSCQLRVSRVEAMGGDKMLLCFSATEPCPSDHITATGLTLILYL